MAKAEAAELDLVEIAPMAKPPVCRIMDYGKFKYREAKKQHEAKLKLKQIQVKEVKFRPGTDEGDYRIKLRNLTRFLGEGDKAKVTLRFRGREMAHQEFGVRLLERIRGDLEPVAIFHWRASGSLNSHSPSARLRTSAPHGIWLLFHDAVTTGLPAPSVQLPAVVGSAVWPPKSFTVTGGPPRALTTSTRFTLTFT